MKSIIIGVTAALTGAVISAAVLASVYDNLEPRNAVADNNTLLQLNDRVQRTEDVLQKISETLTQIEQNSRFADVSRGSVLNEGLQEVSGANVKESSKQVSSKIKTVEDRKKEEILISKLNDSTYISSITMAEFVGSEEMYNLPATSRKKIVEEMVRKLNEGSIDIEQFTKGMAPQK